MGGPSPSLSPSPSPSPSPNPQLTQQWLSSVLSQRGPSALPYAEDVKWLIRQHLLSLSENYPSLQPKTATYTHNDGRTVNLLQSDGTVPMLYLDVTYNIPIIIWLMESYPRHPPCVYVNPTRDMVIKRPHSHVNPSGMVSIPYLHSWVYPSSNLVDLARNLSHWKWHWWGPDSAIPQRHTEDPNEVFRRNAVNKLVESLHADVGVLRKTSEAEVEGMFGAQGVLRQREEQLSRGVKELHDEKEGLEQQLQMVLMNADVLEAWLRENEMLDCTSSDLAIEDTIYALDKAVQEGSISFDQYLKNVRLLSREQFFHRAMCAKLRAAQMQAQLLVWLLGCHHNMPCESHCLLES
ncbi:Protein ELC-like [Vitis vinifera]|uniref:Protein ELC-like n=1 Tax=Vitis vinifera TaxID=29760 RepID=A0A438GV40_VITVI|nr:Protein ELC-like [Vitis vinifera]